jgi:hypothetical protein
VHLREYKYAHDRIQYESQALSRLSLEESSSPVAKKSNGKTKKKKAIDTISSSNNEGNGASNASSLVPPKITVASQEELLVRGRGQLYRGLFRVAVAVADLGLIDKSDIEGTSWNKRFLHRFRMFEDIVTPPALPYSDYCDMLKTKIDATDLLNGASACFKKAKAYFDDAKKADMVYPHEAFLMDGVTSLTKVSVASSVSNMRMAGLVSALNVGGASKYLLVVERNYHPAIPVVEVKEV